MTLQDLKSGDKVIIEVVAGTENKIELPVQAIGSNDKGILLSVYKNNGRVVELNSKKLKGAQINLYCFDKVTGERISFKGLTIATMSHRDVIFYAASVSEFSKFGCSGERRQNRRFQVNRDAVMAHGKSGCHYNIRVQDISANGLSFLLPSELKLPSGYMKIVLDDQVRGHYFRIEIPCEYVRRQEGPEGNLYGCKVMTADKRFLEYINLKKMNSKSA